METTVKERSTVPDGLSADGCIQLLFDFHFVVDVLVGPQPEPSLRARIQTIEALLKVFPPFF
jgi:hypothetical protein